MPPADLTKISRSFILKISRKDTPTAPKLETKYTVAPQLWQLTTKQCCGLALALGFTSSDITKRFPVTCPTEQAFQRSRTETDTCHSQPECSCKSHMLVQFACSSTRRAPFVDPTPSSTVDRLSPEWEQCGQKLHLARGQPSTYQAWWAPLILVGTSKRTTAQEHQCCASTANFSFASPKQPPFLTPLEMERHRARVVANGTLHPKATTFHIASKWGSMWQKSDEALRFDHVEPAVLAGLLSLWYPLFQTNKQQTRSLKTKIKFKLGLQFLKTGLQQQLWKKTLNTPCLGF